MAGLSEGQLAGASEEDLGSKGAVVPMMMMMMVIYKLYIIYYLYMVYIQGHRKRWTGYETAIT